MPTDALRPLIRTADLADVPAIATIYGDHVLHGTASFEEVPPSVDEMTGRLRAVLDAGLPYIVAEAQGVIVGFAYAGPHRPRAAYRHTVEDSIYLAPEAQGRGLGRALLDELIRRCEATGRLRQMIAVIGDSANAGSIAVHTRAGFRMVGAMTNVGFKFGRWLDTVIMQRPLGDA
ncbi:phosphinothricin acetyltransferase [Methylopila capsulata]|uniref:N-acetyltransferase n=1 Tax=Methylopila capsulata TaxID=61654 RepID=A0A9W6IU23_9HYPH|nr:GNAT family N-acetyltransferase [Methylopila capsulata]MBM7850083.1 phosphinothricin acetyltransferase [Methylopila capsulata]GLK55374.1 N-acetyltransferase [Methylopila capsulata]